jgi:hypothetical protein
VKRLEANTELPVLKFSEQREQSELVWQSHGWRLKAGFERQDVVGRKQFLIVGRTNSALSP